MDKVIIGVLGLPVGLLMMIFRYKIVQFFGKIEWAERNLGGGGTYTLVIIVGVIVWIGSLMYALGTFHQLVGFLGAFF